jgi:hypothetical protein
MNNPVPRMAVTKRNLIQLLPTTVVFNQAVGNGESMLGVGSYFSTDAYDYAIRNFLTSTSGLVTVYDQYRFDSIEVYAVVDSFLPPYRPIMVTSSVDYDDSVSGDWYTMSQRNNTKTSVLTVTKPQVMLAKFTPRGNYITAVGDSPSNSIANPTSWWDLANLTQTFNGIKIHASTQNQASIRYYAKAKVSFRGKI